MSPNGFCAHNIIWLQQQEVKFAPKPRCVTSLLPWKSLGVPSAKYLALIGRTGPTNITGSLNDHDLTTWHARDHAILAEIQPWNVWSTMKTSSRFSKHATNEHTLASALAIYNRFSIAKRSIRCVRICAPITHILTCNCQNASKWPPNVTHCPGLFGYKMHPSSLSRSMEGRPKQGIESSPTLQTKHAPCLTLLRHPRRKRWASKPISF